MPYLVVNAQDLSTIAGPFATPEEATAEMLARFPVVEPWDGVEIPVGVIENTGPLFELGRVVATPGAIRVSERLMVPIPELLFQRLLDRHVKGDWGDIHPEDRGLNEEAIRNGERILSVYGPDGDDRLWVITEADRSSTTILRPDEY